MPVIGGTRVISQALDALYELLSGEVHLLKVRPA
jgi:hypothetical protein